MVYGEAISSDRSTVESSTPKEFIRGLPIKKISDMSSKVVFFSNVSATMVESSSWLDAV